MFIFLLYFCETFQVTMWAKHALFRCECANMTEWAVPKLNHICLCILCCLQHVLEEHNRIEAQNVNMNTDFFLSVSLQFGCKMIQNQLKHDLVGWLNSWLAGWCVCLVHSDFVIQVRSRKMCKWNRSHDVSKYLNCP